jgi:hypothetical protein
MHTEFMPKRGAQGGIAGGNIKSPTPRAAQRPDDLFLVHVRYPQHVFLSFTAGRSVA